MTAPTAPQQPNRQLTYQEALAIVTAAAAANTAAQAPGDLAAAAVLQLSAAVIAVRERATDWARAVIGAAWSRVDPYDGAAVQAFTVQAAQHMATAQSATANVAASSQTRILATMGLVVPGGASNPIDVRSPGTDIVDGALVLRRPDSVQVGYDTRDDVTIDAQDSSTQGIFNRPARTVRALRAAGATPQEADQAARTRIDSLVEDNLMLAQRFAEAEILARAVDLDRPAVRVIGYRRVIHPELSRTGVCGMCLAASDRIYHVERLRAIHDRCKCTTAPVTEEHDPAADVNAVDLKQLYGLAGGTTNPQLKRVRFQIDEHGELGPVLVPAKRYKPRTPYRQPRRTPARAR